jgi:hypothetical protein
VQIAQNIQEGHGAAAIWALQKFQLRMKDRELKPEDTMSLRQGIKAFGRKTARKVKIDHNL